MGLAFGRWHEPSDTSFPALDVAVPEKPPALAPPVSARHAVVDDEGHPLDIVQLVTAALNRLLPDGEADNVDVVERALGSDLRGWLRQDFFKKHLSAYSTLGRSAPIYWQIATLSRRYSVWLYAHRVDRDTPYRVVSDLLEPKLTLEERRKSELLEDAGSNPTSKQRRELTAQDAFLEELRTLRDEMLRLAPVWNPNLNDGIPLVVAPLWRLVPHKPWQRELKKNWEDLCAGRYDWAQLAMHLWPERVVPKCAEDRSLAIAHRLEDIFWFEDEDGKWKPRAQPTDSVDDLVLQRTSSAVRDALGAVA